MRVTWGHTSPAQTSVLESACGTSSLPSPSGPSASHGDAGLHPPGPRSCPSLNSSTEKALPHPEHPAASRPGDRGPPWGPSSPPSRSRDFLCILHAWDGSLSPSELFQGVPPLLRRDSLGARSRRPLAGWMWPRSSLSLLASNPHVVANAASECTPPCVFFWDFYGFCLTLKSLIRSAWLFTRAKRWRLSFLLLHMAVQFSQDTLSKRLSFLCRMFSAPLL